MHGADDQDDMTVRHGSDQAATQVARTARLTTDATVRHDVDRAAATQTARLSPETTRRQLPDPSVVTPPGPTQRVTSETTRRVNSEATERHQPDLPGTQPFVHDDDTDEITVRHGRPAEPSTGTIYPTGSVHPAGFGSVVPTRYDLLAGARHPGGEGRGLGASTGPVRIGSGVIATGPPPSKAGPSRSRRRWRQVMRVLSGVVTLLLIGAAAWTGWQWWQSRHNKVTVVAVAVAPAQIFSQKCDIQYDIVGTITTNGKAGTISYEWVRSDGQRSTTLRQSVAAGESSTTVHLYWTFTGQGSLTASATLHVLVPTAIDGTADFPYSCP